MILPLEIFDAVMFLRHLVSKTHALVSVNLLVQDPAVLQKDV